MSIPTLAPELDFPAATGAFDVETVITLVTEFCVAHDVDRHTRYTVVPQLDRALTIAARVGPDRRWRRMSRWSGNNELDGLPETILLTDERDRLYNLFVAGMADADWLPPNTVVSVSRWARFSAAMATAERLGLGWILPVHREILLVPMPVTRYADSRSQILHCTDGRPAVQWSDGTGRYFVHGTEVAAAEPRAQRPVLRCL